ITCIGRMADGNPTKLLSVRCINHDLAATLNFQHIVQGLRLNSKVPKRFQRPNQRRDTVAAPINGNDVLNEHPAQRQ
ncbi:hypothetical protein LPJ57_008012, partial [Coemansia sp. RSA 486]